jgi:hypothetical protein
MPESSARRFPVPDLVSYVPPSPSVRRERYNISNYIILRFGGGRKRRNAKTWYFSWDRNGEKSVFPIAIPDKLCYHLLL